MGSVGTVMFCCFADLLVIMDDGGGGGFVCFFVSLPVVLVRDFLSLVAVLSFAGAEFCLAMGPGFSGWVGLGTS